jgi:hypothetical protein
MRSKNDEKSKFRFIALLLICSILLSGVALGSKLRSSDQIRPYSVSVTPITGSRLAVAFLIAGTKSVQLVGAKTITVYEKNSSYWVCVGGFTQNNSGMTGSNAFSYGNTIYYNATAGRKYRVTVTLFAQDSSGNEGSLTLT